MLFGDEEPGGRLPVTFPRDRSHPPGGDAEPADASIELRYDEGAAIGYRSPAVRRRGALFPFGHALGYAPTRHELVRAEVVDGELQLAVRAVNLGDRATVHVAQVYVELEARRRVPASSACYGCRWHRGRVRSGSSG